MNFYVMKTNTAYAAGKEKLGSFSTRAMAERFARNVQGAHVMDEREYERWHEGSVTPLYRRAQS